MNGRIVERLGRRPSRAGFAGHLRVTALVLCFAHAFDGTIASADGLPRDFVYLRDVAPNIRQDMRYAGADNFTGRPLPGYDAAECVLKRPVARALKRVDDDLAAQGLALKVYDCYRPARAVAAMAAWARAPKCASPETSRFYPTLDKSTLFARGYIALHSAHARGVAVDLTVVMRDGPPAAAFDPRAQYGACTGPPSARAPDDSLDMGTGFDCFDAKSHTRSLAISPDASARRARLVGAMRKHGLVNYTREWWHFSMPSADDRTAYDVPIAPR